MPTPFAPGQTDLDRYGRLRAASRALSDRMALNIPRHVSDEVARSLGMLQRGDLIADSEAVLAVLADCCFYDWRALTGRGVIRVVRLCLENHAADHIVQQDVSQPVFPRTRDLQNP